MFRCQKHRGQGSNDTQSPLGNEKLVFFDCRPFSDSLIVASFGATVNPEARNRITEESQSPELGRSPYSDDSGTQRWRRSEAPPIQSPDLWRGILGNRNTEGSLVSVGELRELVGLIEPALLLAEQRGVGFGASSFWFARSWAQVMNDRDLAAVFVCLSAIKSRLGALIGAGNHVAIDDHVWVSALLADTDDEVLRRVRRHGSPMIGDGSSIDALRHRIDLNRGRMNWVGVSLRSTNAGSAVQA
jgi:hypothetical protein